MPLLRWYVQTRPPSDGVPSEVARSGTTSGVPVGPIFQVVRRRNVRPDDVVASDQLSAGSRPEMVVSESKMVSVPPFAAEAEPAPDDVVAVLLAPPQAARPAARRATETDDPRIVMCFRMNENLLSDVQARALTHEGRAACRRHPPGSSRRSRTRRRGGSPPR